MDCLLNSIKAATQAGLDVDEKKLIASFCYQHGAGHRYVMEYLNEFETMGLITRQKGIITIPNTIIKTQMELTEEEKKVLELV